MCADHTLTHDGCEWLKGYLDPFHDYELKPTGYPDTFGDASVVYRVKKQMTISKDPSLPAGPWDCHIFWTPVTSALGLARACDFVTTDDQLAGELALSTTTVAFGGLMADSVGAGDRTVTASAGPLVRKQILLDDVLASNQNKFSRIISGGFEVANTTAEIQRQGAVTCYATPSYPQDIDYVAYPYATGIVSRTGSATLLSLPPASVTQAQLFPGTRVWEAGEGAYVPFRLQEERCQPTTYQSRMMMLSNTTPTAATSVCLASADCINSVIPGTTNAALNNTSIGPVQFNGFHNHGAYFTGLSDQSTLTVILHADVEVFPSSDSSIISLATPSCNPDAAAIALAAEVQRTLPIATMRRDNDAGDWFRTVLKGVRLASKYLQYVPGPVGTVANIAYDAAGAGQTMMGLSKKDRKKAAAEAARSAAQAAIGSVRTHKPSIPAMQTTKKK